MAQTLKRRGPTPIAHPPTNGRDDLVRPSTTATPNGLLVVEGYKYTPTTTTSSIQVF
jgi:hypothetical protein